MNESEIDLFISFLWKYNQFAMILILNQGAVGKRKNVQN